MSSVIKWSKIYLGLLFILNTCISCGPPPKDLSAQEWLYQPFELKGTNPYYSSNNNLYHSLKAWVSHSIQPSMSDQRTWSSIRSEIDQKRKLNQALSSGEKLAENLSLLGLVVFPLTQSSQIDDHLLLSTISHFEQLTTTASPWIAVIAWGLSHIWKSINHREHLQVKLDQISKTLLSKWAHPAEQVESIYCKTSSIKESQLLHKYTCKLTCPKDGGRSALIVKDPWSIDSMQTELNISYQPTFWSVPKSGYSWITKVQQCEAESSQVLKIIISASQEPKLLWAKPPPRPPAALDRLIPKSLAEDWRERIQLTLHFTPHLFNHYRVDNLGVSFVETMWIQIIHHWSQLAPSMERISNPKNVCLSDQSFTPSNAYIEQALSVTNHSYHSDKVNENLKKLIKKHIVKCAALGYQLPIEWAKLPIMKDTYITSVKEGYYSDEVAWFLADLLIYGGEPLSKVLHPLIHLNPTSNYAVKWLKAYPEWIPKAQSYQSQIQASTMIQNFQKKPWLPLLKGKVGQLLDHQSLYYTENGLGVRWVYEIIRINTRKGVEELGELQLPSSANLIELYQIKANGGRRAPLHILQTEGYSFSDLQVGDWLVAQYFEPIESDRRDGSILTPRLQLKDHDRAVWKRQIKIRLPKNKKSRLPRRVHLPKSKDLIPSKMNVNIRNQSDYQLFFEATELTPQPPEFAALHNGKYNPFIQIGDVYQPNQETRWAAHFIQKKIYSNRYLCLLTQQLNPQLNVQSPTEIAKWIRQKIQRDMPLFEMGSIERSLFKGKGNRALVLSAILHACGFPNEIWLAQPKTAILDRALSKMDDFDHILIKLGDTWIDSSLPSIPWGLVHPHYAGGPILKVWPWEQQKQFTVAQVPLSSMLSSDSKAITQQSQSLTYKLNGYLEREYNAPTGVLGSVPLNGQMTHKFYGADAAILHQKMEIARGQRLRGWVEKQWHQWLGRSEVRTLSFNYEKQILTLNYQLRVWVRDQQTLSLNPQNWGSRFAATQARKSPLYLPTVHQSVHLTFKGVRVVTSNSPQTISLALPTSSQEQKTDIAHPWLLDPQAKVPQQVNAHLEINAFENNENISKSKTDLIGTWTLSGGVVQPHQYETWRQFAQSADRYEKLTLSIK